MDICRELFDRLPGLVHRVVDGLGPDDLARSPGGGANPIGWLVWHLTRIQDDHVAALAGRPQVWEEGHWASRFGLPEGAMDTGYGHAPEQVAAVRPEQAQVLVDYYDAVAEQTGTFLSELQPDDLDRVIDDSYDPPVTVGVRLVSVAGDDLQHVGQAAYVRGLLDLG